MIAEKQTLELAWLGKEHHSHPEPLFTIRWELE